MCDPLTGPHDPTFSSAPSNTPPFPRSPRPPLPPQVFSYHPWVLEDEAADGSAGGEAGNSTAAADVLPKAERVRWLRKMKKGKIRALFVASVGDQMQNNCTWVRDIPGAWVDETTAEEGDDAATATTAAVVAAPDTLAVVEKKVEEEEEEDEEEEEEEEDESHHKFEHASTAREIVAGDPASTGLRIIEVLEHRVRHRVVQCDELPDRDELLESLIASAADGPDEEDEDS